MKRERTQSGFTLVELLIVIVVIAILAAITIIAYNGVTTKARVASMQANLTSAQHLIVADNSTNGTYPLTLADVNGGKGIPASSGTHYTYSSDGTAYCIQATSDYSGVGSWYVSSTTGNIQSGSCPSLVTVFPAGLSATTPDGMGVGWLGLRFAVTGNKTINGIFFDSPTAQTVTAALGYSGTDADWTGYSNLFQATTTVTSGRNYIAFPAPITLSPGTNRAYLASIGVASGLLSINDTDESSLPLPYSEGVFRTYHGPYELPTGMLDDSSGTPIPNVDITTDQYRRAWFYGIGVYYNN